MALYDDGNVDVTVAVGYFSRDNPSDDGTKISDIALHGAVLALHGPGIVCGESPMDFATACRHENDGYCWHPSTEDTDTVCGCVRADPLSCPRIRGVV